MKKTKNLNEFQAQQLFWFRSYLQKLRLQKVVGIKEAINVKGTSRHKVCKQLYIKDYFCQTCLYKVRQAKAKNYLFVVTNFQKFDLCPHFLLLLSVIDKILNYIIFFCEMNFLIFHPKTFSMNQQSTIYIFLLV